MRKQLDFQGTAADLERLAAVHATASAVSRALGFSHPIIFARLLSRRSDLREAFERGRIARGQRERDRDAVLLSLLLQSPKTRREIQVAVGFALSRVIAALYHLVRAGFVSEVREGKSFVYSLTRAGRDECRKLPRSGQEVDRHE